MGRIQPVKMKVHADKEGSSVNDTIAAISTPAGIGGIGIVRISGPDAFSIADTVFECGATGKPSLYKSHSVHYGRCKYPDSGKVADEVLITVMRSPRTYTAEDIVEISCHGGDVSVKKVLEICLLAGARLAEPGEFTKRAFLNGRLDLAQAEAVLDIIEAETGRAQELALERLRGGFSEKIRAIRDSIIGILSSVELLIDFSDRDIDMPSPDGLIRDISGAVSEIENMLSTAETGMMVRNGASVVICGKPNVGKSSLMNALLDHDRSIVTPIAGTTRDIIEESLVIGGVRVRLSDTAGIIETLDRVEIEGIKRSREKLSSSDLVIFVVDSSEPLSEKDLGIYETVKDKKTVVVMNKADLTAQVKSEDVKRSLGTEDVVKISVLKKQGLNAVKDAIMKKLTGGVEITPESAMVTRQRHKQCLSKSAEALERAVNIAGKTSNPELLASDLNEAVYHLGLMIGESLGEDVLDRIFSEFCIGK